MKVADDVIGTSARFWSGNTIWAWSWISNWWKQLTQHAFQLWGILMPSEGNATSIVKTMLLTNLNGRHIEDCIRGTMCPSNFRVETAWIRFNYKIPVSTVRRPWQYTNDQRPIITFSQLSTGKLERGTLDRIVGVEGAVVDVPAELSTLGFRFHPKLKSHHCSSTQAACV